MTDANAARLYDAWDKRQSLMKEAKALQDKAVELDRSRFTAPPSSRVTVWYASMTAYYDAEFLRDRANHLLFEADSLWAKAVTESKGDARVTWDWANTGWRCKLESGEVFEP